METRAAPRIDINVKVSSQIAAEYKNKFDLAKGSVFSAETVDISELGVGIVVKYFLPSGIILDMQIESAAFGLTQPISVKGQVRYCRYVSANKYRCGIKFMEISPLDRKAIASFVERYERRKSPRFKISD